LLILEGGASEVGIESTILDLSRLDQGVGPTILRPGHITAVQIGHVLGAMPIDFSATEPQRASDEGSKAKQQPGEAPGSHDSLSASQSAAPAPRVSGSLKAHYAPHTPLLVLPRQALAAYVQKGLQAETRQAFVVFK